MRLVAVVCLVCVAVVLGACGGGVCGAWWCVWWLWCVGCGVFGVCGVVACQTRSSVVGPLNFQLNSSTRSSPWGAQVMTLAGAHTADVVCALASSHLIVTAGMDFTVVVWDIRHPENPIHVFDSPPFFLKEGGGNCYWMLAMGPPFFVSCVQHPLPPSQFFPRRARSYRGGEGPFDLQQPGVVMQSRRSRGDLRRHPIRGTDCDGVGVGWRRSGEGSSMGLVEAACCRCRSP